MWKKNHKKGQIGTIERTNNIMLVSFLNSKISIETRTLLAFTIFCLSLPTAHCNKGQSLLRQGKQAPENDVRNRESENKFVYEQKRELESAKTQNANESENGILGQYIIKFVDSVQDPVDRMNELIELYEETSVSVANVKWEYNEIFKGVTVSDVSTALLSRLEMDPIIEAIEQDIQYYLDGDNDSSRTTSYMPWSWGLDRIDNGNDEETVTTYTTSNKVYDLQYHYDYTGKGVTIALLDTGVRKHHFEFQNTVNEDEKGSSGTENDNERIFCAFNAFLEDPSEEKNGCHDHIGHGTHMAGIIGGTLSGVAKDVTFLDVKVVRSNDGFLCTGSILAGLDYVLSAKKYDIPNDPLVVNLSFSGPRRDSINESIKVLTYHNIVVVSSSGNDSIDACEKSPASASTSITVGSSTYDDEVSLFSNYGQCIDLYAPGQQITSSWIRSNSDLVTLSGTSMSAAHVTGVIALLLQAYPNAKPSEVEKNLLENAYIDQLTNVPDGSPNLLLRTLDRTMQQ